MSVAPAASSPDITGIAVRALMLYSLAEFQSGHATTIRVTAEGTSFGIADDGRGHSIDRTVDGVSYLRLIYTHFGHPFGSRAGAPVQPQGIGMSFINALCSELSLTVTKKDETLRQLFRNGQLHTSSRMTVPSEQTGTAVSGTIPPPLLTDGTAPEHVLRKQ